MRENMFLSNSIVVAQIYEDTAKNLATEESKAYQKSYNNLTKMLEECYFIGASKFGNNFIA